MIRFATAAYSKLLLILILVVSGVLIGPAESQAQIVFTRSDMDAFIGQRLEANLLETEEPEVTAELQAVLDATGEAATYDFSEVAFEDTLTGALTYFAMPADVPGADDPFFSSADFVVEFSFGRADSDTTMWSFAELREDGLYSLGGIFPLNADVDGTLDTLEIKNEPPVSRSRSRSRTGTRGRRRLWVWTRT